MCDKCAAEQERDDLLALEEFITAAEGVNLGSVKIIPAGADEPLSLTTEADATITAADVKRAIKDWDEKMPHMKGILEARTIGKERTTTA